MRINNNIMAMNTFRQYSINSSSAANSTEKLSSGYRINRAGDDAAGLAISEKMRAQIRGLNMASKNSQDAISLVQTAEGALNETHSILQRMRELSVQSSSDTNQSGTTEVDREALDAEFQALKNEIDDIANKTAFNGKNLLDGSFGSTSAIAGSSAIQLHDNGISSVKFEGFAAGTNGATRAYSVTLGAPSSGVSAVQLNDGAAAADDDLGTPVNINLADGKQSITMDFGTYGKVTIETEDNFVAATDFAGGVLSFTIKNDGAAIQTGANEGDELAIKIDSMKVADLNLDSSDLKTQGNASTAITSVNTAINTVSTQRSKLGAIQNRLQHKINNLDTSSENLSAAESRIRDLDMAKEMTTYTKNNILVQAATAMLAQANSAPQGVLQLLQ